MTEMDRRVENSGAQDQQLIDKGLHFLGMYTVIAGKSRKKMDTSMANSATPTIMAQSPSMDATPKTIVPETSPISLAT